MYYLLMFIVGCETGSALFDSGAQKTVVSESFFIRSKGELLEESVMAGNNNGHRMSVNKGMLKMIKIADKEIEGLDVLVVSDDVFELEDSQGHQFKADMLMGYDIISKFRWRYSPTMRTLDISDSDVTKNEKLVYYNEFPIIKIIFEGRIYNAGIDTGHTETILSSRFKSVVDNIVYIEDEMVGIGTKKKMCVAMVPKFEIEFAETKIVLQNITIQEVIYGAPKEMDILLGFDFFEGKEWEMDLSVGVLKFKK